MNWTPSDWLWFGLLAWPVARWLSSLRSREPSPQRTTGAWKWVLAGVVALTGFAGYLGHGSAFAGPAAPLPGDTSSHAVVAESIARYGLARGWIDTYNGGFPFAIHYPPLASLLDAGLISLGVPARVATHALGFGAALCTPLAFLLVARRLKLEPHGAAVGACVLSTLAPFSPFLGTIAGYTHSGLLAQSLGVLLATLLCAALIDATSSWPIVVLATLLAATHPQIAIVFFVVFAPLVAAQGRRGALHHGVGAVAAAVAMVALYGHGLASLRVPFGWVVNEPWHQIGYPPSKLDDWLQWGQLLDDGRSPVLTSTWALAAVGLTIYPLGLRVVGIAGRGIARLLPTLASRYPLASVSFTETAAAEDRRLGRLGLAVLASCVLAVVLSVSGGALRSMGAVGDAALRAFQPLRALATIPLAVGLVCAVAVQQATWLVRSSSPASRAGRRIRVGFVFAAAAFFVIWVFELASDRWRHASDSALVRAPHTECGQATPEGYSTEVVRDWVSHLSRGRFTFDASSRMRACPAVRGVELDCPVPLGGTFGLGAHVGVNALAFDGVRTGTPGSAARAESLGLRTILHTREHALPNHEWIRLHERQDMILSERKGGTDLIGIACIRERWRGRDPVLRDALVADLRSGASVLASPASVVLLEKSDGPFERIAEDSSGCSVAGVEVSELPDRVPGRMEARVSAPQPVWVTVRVTPTPAWVVTVDDRPVAFSIIAPGFIAAPIPSGVHRVVAEVDWPRGYFAGICLGLTALVALVRFTRRLHPTP